MYGLIFLFIIKIFGLFQPIASQNCLITYQNLSISGNDLNGVLGTAAQCCQLCQQKVGCRAYTWDNFNGGTCWLKSNSQPLAKIDEHSSGGTITGILAPLPNVTYSLNHTYAGSTFFDNWYFSRHGLTNMSTLVNYTEAVQLGLIQYPNGKVYIGIDNTTVLTKPGRFGTIPHTNRLYNSGLFILSMDHMPSGLGTWPAFWTTGPNWVSESPPGHGEIDILEGVDGMPSNLVSIHVRDECYMLANNSQFFKGTWGLNVDMKKPYINCYQYGEANSTFSHSCDILSPNGTFMNEFNRAGGGVYAMQWDRERYIRTWTFVKSNVPQDILNESPNPNPDTWGLPDIHFPLGTNCSPDHFSNQTIVFDIALCGGWASEFIKGGEAACEDAVLNHPEYYHEAYFLVNYLKIFSRPGEDTYNDSGECFWDC